MRESCSEPLLEEFRAGRGQNQEESVVKSSFLWFAIQLETGFGLGLQFYGH